MALQLNLEIDVTDGAISRKEFNARYHYPQKPVILKGLVYQQPAGEKWSIEWFKQIMGDEIIEVYDNTNKRHERATTTGGDKKMPFGEYLDIIARDEHTNLRMFLVNLYKLRPELKKDFGCPRIMQGMLGHLGFMFLGGKDTDVRLHYDVDNSCVLLSQIFGRKRVVLFPPEYSDLLYRLPFNTHSNINVNQPDYEKYPALRHVRGYEFILEPGDAVYMPSGYWHYNTYLEGGMGVSYRRLNPTVRGFLKSVYTLGVLLPLDKMMNRWLGDRWFDFKNRKTHQRAEAARKTYEEKSSESKAEEVMAEV